VRVDQITVFERDFADEVVDVGIAVVGRAPHQSDDLVAFFQQELGQVGTILTGDAGDECNRFGHINSPRVR
jgi:hypothetical protein